MKKLLLFVSITFMAYSAQAKVYYLNNNIDSDATKNTFNTFGELNNYLTDNDTIYVIGSSHNYGSIELTKKLTLIGPGFYLGYNSSTQVNKNASEFDDINFKTGSEGSVIEGICSSNGSYSEINIQISDITIRKCYVRNKITFNENEDNDIKNIIIAGCYFNSTSYNVTCHTYYEGVYKNFVFTNNILNGTFYTPSGSDGFIMNNLFLSDVFKPGASSSFEIKNNIVMGDDEDKFVMQLTPSISVTNNISARNFFGTENGNQVSKSAATLFPGETVESPDGKYQSKEGSSAIGAGSDGTDIGPFGGSKPYCLSGLPSLPNIYEITTGGFVSGDNLNIQIKIKQQ